MTNLIIISLITLFLNIPFGYWRSNVKKFSFQWVLAIHIPVPIIIILRVISGIGFGFNTYLFLVIAFFSGQKIGAVIHYYLEKIEIVSSCLFMDIRKLIFK